MNATKDISPTLTDSQVLEFCKTGYTILPGVVAPEINKRVLQYADRIEPEHPELLAARRSGDIEYHLPLLEEDWFVENVLLNNELAGVIRSLLGRKFALPIIISDHFTKTPIPRPGKWHRDGNYVHDKKLNYLEVFYHPEGVPVVKGPTMILPGSHHLASGPLGHYGNLKGAVHFESPPGSFLIMSYNLWHRRGSSTAKGVRHLFRFNYWRTSPPVRDWQIESDFDPRTASYEFFDRPTTRPATQDCNDAAEMFFWLCGRHDSFGVMGGQCWPSPHKGLDGRVMGFPGDPTDERIWSNSKIR